MKHWKAIKTFVASMTPLAMVLAAVAAVGLGFGGWKLFDHFNDRQAVQEATDAHNAQVNADLREAEGAAGQAKAARDRSDDAAHDELEDIVDDAETDGTSPADDVWNSDGLWGDSPS